MPARWNAKVGERDEVYIVGDLFFRAATVEPILKALHGRKHLVVGNHDHSWMGRVQVGDDSRRSYGTAPRSKNAGWMC